jgi:catechol 2,3-dioxygenase-like lactoylglutathione lyase family enzyme
MARHQGVPRRAIATHPRLIAQSGYDTAQHGRILRNERMAQIKHIALTTHNLEQVASFYKDVFGMTEVGRGGSTHIYLSDGNLNLTIRACKKRDDPDVGEQGEDFSGIHHIGFVVDDVLACAEKMEQAGATRLTPLDAAGRRSPSGRGPRPSQAEIKLRGPDGVIIDISETGWLGNDL